jgi:hypothetical protein
MEWTLLFLLVPLIVAPVVLLWGYAGCSFEGHGYTPTVPENLTVTSVGPGFVDLAWTHEDGVSGVTFEVDQFKGQETIAVTTPVSATSVRIDHLLPSTPYHFRVRAVYGGFETEDSAQVDATTLPAVPCFSAALATDQAPLEGFCIVQRIEPPRLAAGGDHVILTIRGSTTGNLVLDRVFISQPAAIGNPYDSAADLTPVAAALSVPANTAVRLEPVLYTLDPARPLLVIFDVNATPGNGNVRYLSPVSAAEAIMHFKSATAEAAVADRSPPAANPGAPAYAVSNSIYLVESIEVA